MKPTKKILASISRKKNLSERNRKLKELFQEYDYTDIIGFVAEFFSLESILECFSKTDLIQYEPRKVKKIATYYTRMNNGGVQRVLASLLCLWVDMGYEVILYTDQPVHEADYYYPAAVKRILVPETSDAGERGVFWKKTLRENNIDLIVYHEWMAGYLMWDMLIAKTLRIPFIIYTHGHFTELYDNCNDYRLNTDKIYAMSDMVISLAECNDRFYKLCGCNTILLDNPISPELKKNNKVTSLDSHNIIWVGRICEGKRIEDAVKTFSLIHQSIQDAELYIIGSGDLELLSIAYSLVNELGIAEAVHFEGFQENIEPYYLKAGMMLMTSEREGYPAIILESKAYGVPLVMYQLPYLTLTKDKKGLRTAEIGDYEGLARESISILRDNEYRKDLSKEARESFETVAKYDIIGQWKEIFKRFSVGIAKTKRTTADELMMQMFMEQLRQGVVENRTSSKEYKVGKMLLSLPRKVQAQLRYMKYWSKLGR